jgi:DNA modification methylase
MPGENLILDPFVGSGTTAIACILEGCNYVGIDKDSVAMRIAEARVGYFKKRMEKK